EHHAGACSGMRLDLGKVSRVAGIEAGNFEPNRGTDFVRGVEALVDDGPHVICGEIAASMGHDQPAFGNLPSTDGLVDRIGENKLNGLIAATVCTASQLRELVESQTSSDRFHGANSGNSGTWPNQLQRDPHKINASERNWKITAGHGVVVQVRRAKSSESAAADGIERHE